MFFYKKNKSRSFYPKCSDLNWSFCNPLLKTEAATSNGFNKQIINDGALGLALLPVKSMTSS